MQKGCSCLDVAICTSLFVYGASNVCKSFYFFNGTSLLCNFVSIVSVDAKGFVFFLRMVKPICEDVLVIMFVLSCIC